MRKLTRAFRENSRVLLLVFMSLLLVIFLLGDVIGRGNRGDQIQDIAVGKAFDGESVMLSQVNRAETDWQLAQMLLPEMEGIRRGITSPNQLYLLMREAELAGVRVGAEQVRTHLQLGEMQSAMLDRARKQNGRSLDSIYEGIGRALGILEYLTLQIDGLSDSVPQLEHDYRQQMQSALVKYSVIDDRALLSLIPDPTPAELEAHFAEAKDRTTQHSTDTLSFGYRIPEKVEIEYLTVEPRELVNKMIVRDREVERFYEENKSRYTKRVASTTSAPDGAPPPPPQTVQMTLDECREAVKNDLRQARASEEAGALVNKIQEELRRPWMATTPGPDGRRPAPSTPPPSLEELSAKYSSQYPVVYRKTNLVDRAELTRDPDLANFRATFEQRQFTLAQQAFNADGLSDGKATPALPLLRVNEPSNVFVSMRGKTPYQSVVFRVVRVVPAGPPASLDDVKTQAIENWKLVKAHALAGEWAKKLSDAAHEKGLETAVGEAGELKTILAAADGPTQESQPATAPAKEYAKQLGPLTQDKFTRRSSSLPYGVQNPKLPTEIFALAEPTATAAAHKVVTLPVAANFKWVVAELVDVNPIYAGEFDMLRARVASIRASQLQQMFLQTWFDPAHVELRTGFSAAPGASASSGS